MPLTSSRRAKRMPPKRHCRKLPTMRTVLAPSLVVFAAKKGAVSMAARWLMPNTKPYYIIDEERKGMEEKTTF